MIGMVCNFNWGRLVTSRATRIHNGHECVWGLPVVAAYEYLPRLLDWAAARSRESPSKSGDVVSPCHTPLHVRESTLSRTLELSLY